MLKSQPIQNLKRSCQTVLVVDDGWVARDMLARLLRLDGYQALTAGDGESALTAIEAGRPDLVLLDLTMPDMDGLEVLRRLRADHRHDGLPVVLFTAVSDPRFVTEAMRLGAADYLVKGNGPDEVLASVARHLPCC
jgi:DNA-binding response OmpR family regulator